MEKGLRERNCAIDIAKFLAAVLVIAIHTRPLKDISCDADFFLCDIICRMAVPFFAICTGFYSTMKWEFADGRLGKSKANFSLFARTIRKLIKIYLFWSFIYLGLLTYSWMDKGLQIDYHYYVGWLYALVVDTSYYHLWYLTSIGYAFVWFYLLLRYVRFKYLPIIAMALWIIEIAEYAYRTFLPCGIQEGLRYFDYLGSISISFTRMLPLLLAGAIIARCGEIKRIHLSTCILFILLLTETYLLRQNGVLKFSFVFFTLPLSFYLFALIYRLGSKASCKSNELADISLFVYCIHPILIYAISDKLFVQNRLMVFVLAAISSVALGLLYQTWKTTRR